MRSAGASCFLFLFLLLASIGFISRVWAADQGSSSEQFKSDLSDIKLRLVAIEERQKEILAKEDQILQELDRVRIWVHRK